MVLVKHTRDTEIQNNYKYVCFTLSPYWYKHYFVTHFTFLINFKIKIKIDKIDTDKTKLDCIMLLHSYSNINFLLLLHTLFILYIVEVVTVPFYSFESYQWTITVIQSLISLLPNAATG